MSAVSNPWDSIRVRRLSRQHVACLAGSCGPDERSGVVVRYLTGDEELIADAICVSVSGSGQRVRRRFRFRS